QAGAVAGPGAQPRAVPRTGRIMGFVEAQGVQLTDPHLDLPQGTLDRLVAERATSMVTIVGVVADARQRPDVLFPQRPEIYLSYWQNAGRIRDMASVIRTSTTPTVLAEVVRRQVQALDPQQPICRVRDTGEIVANGPGSGRLSLVLLTAFGAVTLMLSIHC